ncbi:AraC family transcriptional regulator [Chitinophaga sp. Cy-1792]|uniref:helix-turn-helix transcriptional regulator n=1 Tax=Chitinophaga sp. Cy-1792 TaxID=2608339 RepID=UPI00141E8D97|nr:AraC family transcriptional regulator [Chitinophaga sp. Cy-1792]NIG57729.1 helix-turn-helix transcriptional regulator [Chitinophaga sp. Cy-1792]
MAVVIKNDASDILWEKQIPFSPEKIASTTIVQEKAEFSYDFGNASFNSLCFDGYHLAHGKAEVYQNLHITHDVSDEALVDMFFMKHGDINTSFEGVTKSLRFSSLEHNLMFAPRGNEEAAVKKQDGLSIFVISFTRDRFLELAEHNGDVLDQLANSVAGNRPTILGSKQNPHMTPRMNAVIEDIVHCNFKGGIKKLYLQSKILELLALQAEQAGSLPTGITTRSFNASDREKLDHARTILLNNLQQPPTLAQLARMTGLNEFKLKAGFREVYHNSVFGYLSDHRLAMARELILEGKLSLTMIAEEAGYSSLPHFSNAFRKKYGTSPSSLRIGR